MMKQTSGKLYLWLVAGVGMILSALGWLSWYAISRKLPWYQAFVGLLFGVFAFFALVVFAGLVAISYGLHRTSHYSYVAYRLASGALYWLYQPAALLGRAFRVEKDRIRASFILLHNQLASSLPLNVAPERLLILAPVCLQLADCPHKVTVKVENCARCGRCRVNDLLGLKEKYGVHVAVATGGTYARKLLKDLRPQAVVAIACERDLVSGLQDSRPLLVLGVTNERPNGPCFNTTVDLSRVEAAVRNLLGKGTGRETVPPRALVKHGQLQ